MSQLLIAATPAAPTVPAAPAPTATPVTAAPANAAKNVPAAPGKIEVPPPQAPQKQAPSAAAGWLQMLPFILIFVVMIFFMNRSQKKQMQKRQEMLDKITKGTKVLLSSGIYGTVDAVQEDAMVVEIATGVKIRVAKAGIADVVPEGGKVEGK